MTISRGEDAGVGSQKKETWKARAEIIFFLLALVGGAPAYALFTWLLDISIWFVVPLIAYGLLLVYAATRIFTDDDDRGGLRRPAFQERAKQRPHRARHLGRHEADR